MPVKFNFNTFALVKDPQADLGITDSDTITATLLPGRKYTAIVHGDEGVDAIVNPSYDIYFDLSRFDASAVWGPFSVANIIGDQFDMFLSAGDSVFVFHLNSAGNMTIQISHTYGASQQETSSGASFAFQLNNEYRQNVTISGQNIILTIYDEGGGHGPPGAAIYTDTLAAVQTIEPYRYPYPFATLDQDNFPAALMTGRIGPMWDMKAVGPVPLDGGLLITVAAEDRVINLLADDRLIEVAAEDRILEVS